MKRELTGWHVLAIFGGGFAVIITVNLILAYNAVQTFPGIVTKNSYVASQSFERDRDAQDALGWDVRATLQNGTLLLAISDDAGRPLQPKIIKATLGRATNVAQDVEPEFIWAGDALVATVDVPAGYWTLWLEMKADDGTAFRRRLELNTRDGSKS